MKFTTAGESHGRCLLGILEGIPAGLPLSESDINPDLKRRMGGYGRGGRMKIESDAAEILTGIFRGKTIGAPISVMIENKDWQLKKDLPVINYPRPGHADLAGLLKYDETDIRAISERASARETAARVAVGAIAKRFLAEFGIDILGVVTEIGGIAASPKLLSIKDLREVSEASPLGMANGEKENEIIELIDRCKEEGDSLGGAFTVIAEGVPCGLGSHSQWDERLDAELARAIISIQAMKAVEIGEGMANARRKGSEAHDQIGYHKEGFFRHSNHAGGTEGGISNGEPIVVTAYMKPISSIHKPMASIDMKTKEEGKSHYQRSDVTAVTPARVVGEAMVALVLATFFLKKFGGDSMTEVKRNYQSYLEHVKTR